MVGMTKKIAISVPDDVAEHLARQPNVSAYITESVRRRVESDDVRAKLRSVGFAITDASVAAARAEYGEIMGAVTPELRAEAEKLREYVRGAGHPER